MVYCGLVQRRIIVGLTGNIGTGKSTILAYLRQQGAYVLDADRLAHQAIMRGGPAYADVVSAFGRAVVGPDGEIDRSALAGIVFSSPDRLRELEAIVHPAVYQLAAAELAATDASVVIVEAIKLLESGHLLTLCDEVWVVTSSSAAQEQRLSRQRGMSDGEIQARLAAQSSQQEKVKRATRVIENDGTLAELYAQLDVIWRELVSKTAGIVGTS